MRVLFGAIAVAIAAVVLLATSFASSFALNWFASLGESEQTLFRVVCLLTTVVAVAVAALVRWRMSRSADER